MEIIIGQNKNVPIIIFTVAVFRIETKIQKTPQNENKLPRYLKVQSWDVNFKL